MAGFSLISPNLTAQNQNLADSLLIILKHQPELPDSVKLSLLNEIYINHTDQDSIIYYSNEAIKIAKKNDDLLGLHSAYLNIGHAKRTKGDLDEALNTLFTCIKFAERADYQEGVAAGYSAIGDVYSVQGNTKNALTYYNRAIDVFRKEADSIRLATSLLNTGDEYFSNDKLDSALIYFEQSSEIFELLNSPIGKAYNLGNIGLVYAKQGRHDLAEKNINLATRILEELGDRYPIAVYEIYMAEIYNKKGDFERALGHAHKSLLIAEEEGLKEQIRDASLKLSELYQSAGDYKNAFKFQSTYLAYKDRISNEETIQKMADLRTDFEVAQKQAELDLANKTKEAQQIVGIGLGMVLILVGALAYTFFKNNRKEKKTNLLLSAQKEEITNQRDQLVNLNNTKDRFFSIVSHDLRGPVNAFQGITRIIKSYADRNQLEKIPEMLEVVDKSSNQLSVLLDNLLNWALSQQGNFPYIPEKLNIKLLTDELLAIFNNMALAKNIELTRSVESDIYLWCDRNSTMAIFRNLINNAIKFTPENGKVSISATADGRNVQIHVTDTGIGMPRRKLSRLFTLQDKKQSSDGTAGEKGTGLGLVICKEFARLNRGSISVESDENTGTVFTVTLPLFVAE